MPHKWRLLNRTFQITSKTWHLQNPVTSDRARIAPWTQFETWNPSLFSEPHPRPLLALCLIVPWPFRLIWWTPLDSPSFLLLLGRSLFRNRANHEQKQNWVSLIPGCSIKESEGGAWIMSFQCEYAGLPFQIHSYTSGLQSPVYLHMCSALCSRGFLKSLQFNFEVEGR